MQQLINYTFVDRNHLSSILILVILFFFGSFVGCTSQDQSEQLVKSELEAKPDLTQLPANLRRRLREGEARVKVLKAQRITLESQVEQLEALEAKYQSDEPSHPKLLKEAKARVSEAHQRLDVLEQSLSELTSLIERIKLQALADEMVIDEESDDKLTSFLTDAVEVYDELGELSNTKREAKLGQVDAQFKLGKRYEKGEGLDQSDVEALKWYEKAAVQGHEQASLATGFFYRHGRGSSIDQNKALIYYKKAADLGNLMAAHNLGLIYWEKSHTLTTTSTALRKAKQWFAMAASGGVKAAQLNLAKIYINEAEKSPNQSIKKYTKAQKLLKRAQSSAQRGVADEAKNYLTNLAKQLQPALKKRTHDQLHWISLPSGSFLMGDPKGNEDAKVVHKVQVKAFSLSASEVTVNQYQSCVLAGKCDPLNIDKKGCNHRKNNHGNLPVNCVSWIEARAFAQWVGGDLPSETQWEYAARSAGQFARYPWGDQKATCTLAVMRDEQTKSAKIQNHRKRSKGAQGCGKDGAWPVCTKTAGMSKQGLCDMIGNLWEWTLDEYRPHYDQTHKTDLPVCASKRCTDDKGIKRVIRGAGYMTKSSGTTATMRSKSDRAASGIGFRVALKTQMDE
jgi:formylglycine-generating enzyme required for sulfatase activity